MFGLLAPFIGKLLGLLVIVAGLLAVYLGVKRKGVLQERDKWEKATTEAKVRVTERVLEAVSKDAEIDKRVDNEKERIKEVNKLPIDSNNKFRF